MGPGLSRATWNDGAVLSLCCAFAFRWEPRSAQPTRINEARTGKSAAKWHTVWRSVANLRFSVCGTIVSGILCYTCPDVEKSVPMLRSLASQRKTFDSVEVAADGSDDQIEDALE